MTNHDTQRESSQSGASVRSSRRTQLLIASVVSLVLAFTMIAKPGAARADDAYQPTELALNDSMYIGAGFDSSWSEQNVQDVGLAPDGSTTNMPLRSYLQACNNDPTWCMTDLRRSLNNLSSGETATIGTCPVTDQDLGGRTELRRLLADRPNPISLVLTRAVMQGGGAGLVFSYVTSNAPSNSTKAIAIGAAVGVAVIGDAILDMLNQRGVFTALEAAVAKLFANSANYLLSVAASRLTTGCDTVGDAEQAERNLPSEADPELGLQPLS